MAKIKKISMAMEKDRSGRIKLVIETAFGGGSLALFQDEKELDIFKSESMRTKSEDLLSDIWHLFEKNKIEKSQIFEIIYATEAGSQTGLRIGRATAEGLSSALDCKCSGVSVLEALTLKISKVGVIQTAFADAGNKFIRQIFSRNEAGRILVKSSPQILSEDVFCLELEIFEETLLLIDSEKLAIGSHQKLTIYN